MCTSQKILGSLTLAIQVILKPLIADSQFLFLHGDISQKSQRAQKPFALVW
jgi:hypothetical protein